MALKSCQLEVCSRSLGVRVQGFSLNKIYESLNPVNLFSPVQTGVAHERISSWYNTAIILGCNANKARSTRIHLVRVALVKAIFRWSEARSFPIPVHPLDISFRSNDDRSRVFERENAFRSMLS